MLKEMLIKLGLSEKEAHIYEAALESGPETAQKIARRAGITRTGTYIYIQTLIRKGLMGKTTRDKKTYFCAEPPENLANLLELQKEEAKRLSAELEKTMPQLRTLFEANEERPHVRFFEGRLGLQSMVHDFLKSKFESVEEFVPLDDAYAFSPPQKDGYRDKVNKKFKNIPMRTLYTSEKSGLLKPKEGSRERRFLPKEKFPFTGSLTIYGNKVSLISQKKTVTGVIVENNEIAATLRTLFNLAWEAAAHHKN